MQPFHWVLLGKYLLPPGYNPLQVGPFQVDHFRLAISGWAISGWSHFRLKPFQVTSGHFSLGPFQVRAISGWLLQVGPLQVSTISGYANFRSTMVISG